MCIMGGVEEYCHRGKMCSPWHLVGEGGPDILGVLRLSCVLQPGTHVGLWYTMYEHKYTGPFESWEPNTH